ncbi:MAG: site-2 protease family protein [Waddliaceae bacterium]
MSFLYIILAILGLSFLIFIHELGHYWVARRVGMRVETFSVGFGKPIYSWFRDGVKWQIGWLPFGGFVKIAGMDGDTKKDPYKISDGFFGKSPLDRIKVAFAGPFVNLLFAFLVFTVLWISGGRDKEFSEMTSRIGWLDPQSELYEQGIRPGDEIVAYEGHKLTTAKDHLQAPLLAGDQLSLDGYKVDVVSGNREPFQFNVKTYPHPLSMDKEVPTIGVLSSARYVIYDRLPGGKENPLPEGSPMNDSGLNYGDRVLWADGELIFSETQLSNNLNDDRVLMTIGRENTTFVARVPRVRVKEIYPDTEFREELTDWQFEAGLNGRHGSDLFTVPYNLTADGIVEGDLRFIDEEKAQEVFPKYLFSKVDEKLLPGDRILAVQGTPVKHSHEILSNLQEKQVQLIVQRDPEAIQEIHWEEADAEFFKNVDWMALNAITSNIGKPSQINSRGTLHLLNPVTPKKIGDLPNSQEARASVATTRTERLKEIEAIQDPEKRRHIQEAFDQMENRLYLGIPSIQDRAVTYNPNPLTQFSNIIFEMGRTLRSLFSGAMSPKYLAGPIGIVHMVHHSTMLGLKEALFWLGLISLNLGFLNLLPIPVLDGGTIVFSLFEIISGKKIKPKMMENLILPFAVLLIIFFVFLTYNDISRVIERIL